MHFFGSLARGEIATLVLIVVVQVVVVVGIIAGIAYLILRSKRA